MNHKTLLQILKQLEPEEEICMEIYDLSGEQIHSTYAIDFDLDEERRLILRAAIEQD